MNRRDFLGTIGAAACGVLVPAASHAAGADYGNLLILVELKGGNDALNTVVPYASADYYSLRPRLALPRDQVLQLDPAVALHPSLQALMPAWRNGELAVIQGVGYPHANLSHFRSIEIWDTAADSTQYLSEGWLARAFAAAPAPRSYAADGIVVGGNDMGPLAGARTRAIALRDTAQFLRQAPLAAPAAHARTGALEHILKVQSNIAQAAAGLTADYALQTDFPATPFGTAARTAAQLIAAGSQAAVIKLALNGFDTHSNQQPTQARLLKDLAEGLAALSTVLKEAGRWQSTLIVTYSEFGRRPRENQSAGTDHGTAASHFALGGKVRGGLYGAAPDLSRLDGNGNLPHAVDFREVYATVLERWWHAAAAGVLGGRYSPVEFLRG